MCDLRYNHVTLLIWFPTDDLVPEVVFCPEDYEVVGESKITSVTWEEPVFRDPTGHDLEVNNNLAEGNTALLPWGRHTVVYTASNNDNGQKAVCQFTIIVERKMNVLYFGENSLNYKNGTFGFTYHFKK